MKTGEEMGDEFDFKAAGERDCAPRNAVLEARKPIALEDWDREQALRNELAESQKIEIQVLSDILSLECPSSSDQLDKYLVDNKQKIKDAYMSSCSGKIEQVRKNTRKFFVGIVEAFNALVHQVNQLSYKPPKRQAEGGDIELKTFMKSEVDFELPVAQPIPQAEPLNGLHMVQQADHVLHPAIAQPVADDTGKFINFVMSPDEETKKISSLQSFFEGFRKAISTAIQGLSGRSTRNMKAEITHITAQSDGDMELAKPGIEMKQRSNR